MILRLERLEPGGLIVRGGPEVKEECWVQVHKRRLPWGKWGSGPRLAEFLALSPELLIALGPAGPEFIVLGARDPEVLDRL